MQVGQFPSIHLSSNWRSLQRMLAFQQWHKHKHTHTHTHIFWYCTTAEKNWNKSPLCVECRYYLSTRVRSNMLHQNHVGHFFFRPPIPRTFMKFIQILWFYISASNTSQSTQQALLPFLEKNQSWDSAPTCKHFLWQKNNCETKPHGRQKLNNKNIQQTKLANNSHNIHEKYIEKYTYFCPKNQPIFHIFPWP